MPTDPYHVRPRWVSDTVALLAGRMLAASEWSQLPILADALQDSGCDNEAVLHLLRASPATTNTFRVLEQCRRTSARESK